MSEILYFGISTLGSAGDFGVTTGTARYGGGAASNGTRGLYAGGFEDPAYSNVIDYVTIATTGNATDFGDCVTTYTSGMQGVAGNPTGGASNANRGLFAGGYNPLNLSLIHI